MADKKDKAIKEDFTHFLLDDDESKVRDPSKKNPEKTQITGSHIIPNDIKYESGEVTKKKPIEKTKHVQSSSMQDHMVNVEASLKQSEYLRIAQKRITELEKNLDVLRTENEQLSTAAIILQKKYETLTAKIENAEKQIRNSHEIHKEEKALLENIVNERNREKNQFESKIEELHSRLQEKLNGVRVRERELENRLELIKIEGQVALNSKDEMILDLRHKLDQLAFELENYKTRGKDLNAQAQTYKDQIRRTVKALRLALTMLEGEGLAGTDIKKTGSDS